MGGERRARLRAVPDAESATPSLPAYTTLLIGRDTELDELLAALGSGQRVVTLTGVGGVGKTRLAVAAAEASAGRFDGSVLFVALRPVGTTAGVYPAIAAAAGWHLADEAQAEHVVVPRLAERPTLLVLDNVEQIEAIAEPVSHLAVVCPNLSLLITSRRALGLSFESVIELAPLPPAPAADLLTVAARAHDSRFAVTRGNADAVAELCARLDGLPLAIELAAARLRLLSPADLVGLLDERFAVLAVPSDGPDYHRSMWAAIDWSYGLLTPDDQRRFRALAVFPDTFDLTAAAAVSGDRPAALADSITALVDHHLVQVAERSDGPTRFALLETLREFAAVQLTKHGETEAVGRRLIGWCEEFAERVGPQVSKGDGPASEALAGDLPAIRVALHSARSAGLSEPILHIIAATWPWWPAHGRVREALGYVTDAVSLADAPADQAPAPARLAAALRAGAELALRIGDTAMSGRFAERARAIFAEIGDEAGLAEALYSLGWGLSKEGELDRAEQVHQQQLEICRRLELVDFEAGALSGLGSIAFERRDHRRAATYFERTFELFGRSGNRLAQSAAATNVGVARSIGGDHEGAVAAYSNAIAIADELADLPVVAHALASRGESLTELGRYEEAEADLRRAVDVAAQAEAPWVTSLAAQYLGRLHLHQGRLGRAAQHFADSVAGSQRLSQHFDALCGAELFASVAVELGEAAMADRVLSVTVAARAATGTPPSVEVAAGPGLELVDDWETALAELVPELEAFATERADAVRAERDDPLTALGLSEREAEVARLVAARRTDAEIAAELFVSQHTAVSHVAAVRRKLGVQSRRDVAARLAELGIVLSA